MKYNKKRTSYLCPNNSKTKPHADERRNRTQNQFPMTKRYLKNTNINSLQNYLDVKLSRFFHS